MPFRDLLPMVHPNDIIFDGMDNCYSAQGLTSTEKCVYVDQILCECKWESEVTTRKSDSRAVLEGRELFHKERMVRDGPLGVL